MKPRLTADHIKALRYIAGKFSVQTYRVAQHLGYDRIYGHNATSKARNKLLMLERHGYAEHDGPFWKATTAGIYLVEKEPTQ
jgi:hypothetical protein